MTKKHYEAIAAVIREMLYISGYNPATYDGMTTNNESISTTLAIMTKIANVLEKDNPKFNRERFIRACKEPN